MQHRNFERINPHNEAYAKAQQLALQIKEELHPNTKSHKGIKVYSKLENISGYYSHADATVVWKNGPENWAHSLKILDSLLVCHTVDNGHTVSFYSL